METFNMITMGFLITFSEYYLHAHDLLETIIFFFLITYSIWLHNKILTDVLKNVCKLSTFVFVKAEKSCWITIIGP